MIFERFRSVGCLFAACLLVTGGCASTPQLQPGTGDVSFRLVWEGIADLDLHVEDPDGSRLSFVQRQTDSGGLLDIDCNAGPEQLCKHPIENVYWPEGSAPEGIYRYRAELFRGIAGDASHSTYIEGREVERGASAEADGRAELLVPFTLEVRLGDEVVVRQTGVLSHESRIAGPYEYEFAGVPPVPSTSDLEP